jgi:hypothetical protein
MAYKSIPEKESELVVWGENFINQIVLYAGPWEIPPHEVDELKNAYTQFANLHSVTDSPARTTIIVAQKNEAKEIFLSLTRLMIDFRLQNPIITNDQRIALGIHVKDKIYTPILTPSKAPKISVSVEDKRQVKISIQDVDKSGKSKSYGIIGGVITYAILASPPSDQEQLTHSVLATRSTHVLTFKEEDRGKTVYIAARWENEKGETGPWSDIISTIIP